MPNLDELFAQHGVDVTPSQTFTIQFNSSNPSPPLRRSRSTASKYNLHVSDDTHKCGKCKEVKSIDDFAPSDHYRSGHDFMCRACRSALCEGARAVLRDKIQVARLEHGEGPTTPERKLCFSCQQERPASYFYYCPTTVSRLASRCRVCMSASARFQRVHGIELTPSDLHYLATRFGEAALVIHDHTLDQQVGALEVQLEELRENNADKPETALT